LEKKKKPIAAKESGNRKGGKEMKVKMKMVERETKKTKKIKIIL
jgi:hypothetical protein